MVSASYRRFRLRGMRVEEKLFKTLFSSHFQIQVDEKLLYVIMRGILAPHHINQAMKTAVVKKVKGVER